MKKRCVVTAFLEHQGKILLLKRSGKVRTYPYHWAGVSGSIEEHESPDERVLKEIEEETGLSPEAVQFVRKGKPLQIEDGSILWRVYPFLYHVPEPAEIRTDWEHVEKQWIEPDQITSYPTVPNLKQTLDSVYLGQPVVTQIAEIGEDRVHGASELVLMALEVLKTTVEEAFGKAPDEPFAYLSNVGWHLHNARPTMILLTNAVAFVLYHAKQRLSQGKSASDFKAHFSELIDQYRTTARKASQIIVQKAHDLLSDNMMIFTHSYSSTVVAAILDARRKGFQIIVTKSRPLNEGVKTARLLSEQYPVTLITDAQAGHFMQKADIVFIGADAVLPDGAVVSKAGTYLIALAAKKQCVPAYVLCQTDKFHVRASVELEEKDSQEVFSETLPNVSARNLYFEITPDELISAIVTEKGIMQPKDVLPIVQEMVSYVKILE